MQALALQFNLSETTFILPSERASAEVRIFTPTFEMPFAGHPTLGTAHVVRALQGGAALTLDMKAGIIPVQADGDVWTLQANAPRHRPADASRADLAAMLGIDEADLAATPPLWVDTGSEQLVIPLANVDAVRRTAPRADLMLVHGSNGQRAMAYVWAPDAVHRCARRPARGDHRALLLSETRGGDRGPRHGLRVRQPRRLAARHECRAAEAHRRCPGRRSRPAVPPDCST